MNCKSFLTTFLLIMSLSNCATWLPDAHKIDINQGNNLEKEQIDKLEIGFTKEQVSFLLGNSITTPNKNNNKWVYLYYKVKAGVAPDKINKLVLIFKNNKLISFKNLVL